MKTKIYNFINADYITRRGEIIPLTHKNYFDVGQDDQPTREELIEAFYKLTHNRLWNQIVRVLLTAAAALLFYVLLEITKIPQP
jgi:hypothetical protein